MTTLLTLKDNFDIQQVSDYVVFNGDGKVELSQGDFYQNSVKCVTAYQILQQSAHLLRNEKLKRVTITFPDAVYIATVLSVDGKPHGVVMKQSRESLDKK